jgi:murein L,D-transpeptidase YcbB/YkuD
MLVFCAVPVRPFSSRFSSAASSWDRIATSAIGLCGALLLTSCDPAPPREAPKSALAAVAPVTAPQLLRPEHALGVSAATASTTAPVREEPSLPAEREFAEPMVVRRDLEDVFASVARRDTVFEVGALPAPSALPDSPAPGQAGGPPAAMPPAGQGHVDNARVAPLTTDPAVAAALARHVAKDPLAPVLKAFYSRRSGAPAFHDGLASSAAAAEMVAMVKDLPSHAIDPKHYALDKVTLGTAVTPDLAAERDVRLSSALLRYVSDFRFIRRIHPFKSVAADDESDFYKRTADAIAEVGARSVSSVKQSLEDLWPRRHEYSVLRLALPVWRQKAEEEKTRGRPPAVPIKRIDAAASPKQKKAQTSTITALQERLRFDGYLGTDPTGELDEATMAAVKAFQHRHNLTEDGMPGLDTLKRFRETNATKARQVELSLQRWREAEVLRDAPVDYIRVNLPGFLAEFFERGERGREHRVIVGNTKLDFNQDDWKQGYINRTPLLETRLYKVILNPTWIVPTRIRDGEILVESAKDPNYLKKQGIHVRTMSDGSDKYVQSAGDHNVLGQVKFMLEKTDAVYLHDTNKRKFFDKSERSLSHGCMRVDKAVDLAHYIVSTRSSVSREKVDAILEAGNTTEVLLDKPIAVYTDYNTVGLDDEGDLVFYLDVYGYDRAALTNDLPPATFTRFGSSALKPRSVPLIPAADYTRLKAQGPAPMQWPPTPGVGSAPTDHDADGP